MRLLNTRTRKLEEFFEKDIPNYAILSHTWGKEEIIFKDFDAELGPRRSSTKIDGCCTQALTDGLDFVWIDTCCIDKSSSAELSEAINSMFAWYEKAKVCYVYLSDVQSVFVESAEFQNSRWFTRGWTLQELLAPQSVMFYNASWKPLKYSDYHDPPTPIDFSFLGNLLAKITGIRVEIIEGHAPLVLASVAERMSWASLRQTTRVEDTAYCLLGLFGIAMPMIYGEGTKAFFRLQEEIVRSVHDHSIFAFGYGLSALKYDSNLAVSPSDFRFCKCVKSNLPLYYDIITSNRSHYTSTNNGLHIQLRLLPLVTGNWIGMLECYDDNIKGGYCAIAVPLFQSRTSKEVFFRHPAACPELVTTQPFRGVNPRQIYIEKSKPTFTKYISGIKLSSRFSKHITVKGTYPPYWDIARGEHEEPWLSPDILHKQVIILDCVNNQGETFLIKIEYSYKRDRNRRNGDLQIPIKAEVTARPAFNGSALDYAIEVDSLSKVPWKQNYWLSKIPWKQNDWQKLENLTSPVGGNDNARLYLDTSNPHVWEIDIVGVVMSPHDLAGPSNPSGSPKLPALKPMPYGFVRGNGTRLARFHELQQKES
ncbi:HET-domain-containing protein [Hyaloscypha variabilis F]|uniref:HET-domain-containing protein n=1 Tax=Hyaloscypha variabilis (strain UAMH 11265 / GT02V1 / F) TaxID=1149755 RepID=A0A2J6RZA3_HYAVF|nr:HET-domain-containing protein [Hyaloscypha variabilis F]